MRGMEEWFTIEPSSGEAGENITITLTAKINHGNLERVSWLYVNNGLAHEMVFLKQAAGDSPKCLIYKTSNTSSTLSNNTIIYQIFKQ